MTEGEASCEVSDPEPEEPAGRGARIAMLAIPISTGLVVLVGTYLAGCGVPWGHVVLAVASLVMGLLARSWLGPGKGAAVAFTMAVLLPLLILSAFEPANEPLLKVSSPYQQLSRVFESGRLAIVTGGATCALLMTVLFLKRRRGMIGRAVPVALWAATAFLAGLALLGADRLATRPSPREFRETIREVAVVRPPPLSDSCLFGQCRDVLFEDRDALLFRECRKVRDCRLWLDLRDEVGPRDITGLDSEAPITLSANREQGVWVLLLPSRYDPSGHAVEHAVGERPRSSFVRAANIRGVLAPEPTSVAFTGAAALLAAIGSLWLLLRRRKRDALKSAREAEMDDDGWINLGGDQPELRRAEGVPERSGPVLVAVDKAVDAYREAAAPPLRVLASGTKAEVIRRFAVDARDVGAVVLTAAAHLAVPLVAEAVAGRLF
ncbi:MAG: hypothetical protein HOV80_11730 [Polyangiaceae bacterium]|nr:hypothetical protein [Polyangiaceae bacterium]